MSKKLLTVGAVFAAIISLCSCGEKYTMPHEPGVTVDEEALNQHSAMWNENKKQNYSYVYSCKCLSDGEKYTINVTVKNGEMTECVMNDNTGETYSLLDSEDDRYGIYSNEDYYIENVYAELSDSIKGIEKRYSEYPDCYYAKIDFEFSDECPYILSYKVESQIMKPDLLGGYGHVEVTISNFEEN